MISHIICVYPDDYSIFFTNGNGSLPPLTATVMETLNEEYELEKGEFHQRRREMTTAGGGLRSPLSMWIIKNLSLLRDLCLWWSQ